MSKQATFNFPGDKKEYSLHPNVKRYTLRDHGFIETKNGNFQYERPLSNVITDKTAPVLKMTVYKNFDRVRVSIVAGEKSAKKVNIFSNENMTEEREMLSFIINEFKEAEILEENE